MDTQIESGVSAQQSELRAKNAGLRRELERKTEAWQDALAYSDDSMKQSFARGVKSQIDAIQAQIAQNEAVLSGLERRVERAKERVPILLKSLPQLGAAEQEAAARKEECRQTILRLEAETAEAYTALHRLSFEHDAAFAQLSKAARERDELQADFPELFVTKNKREAA